MFKKGDTVRINWRNSILYNKLGKIISDPNLSNKSLIFVITFEILGLSTVSENNCIDYKIDKKLIGYRCGKYYSGELIKIDTCFNCLKL